MSHIVAIINQKGGTGKTTSAVNLGAALAYQGFRTLIVDLDPQGHTTVGLGIDPDGSQEEH
jgi:chromosome partitioning protein